MKSSAATMPLHSIPGFSFRKQSLVSKSNGWRRSEHRRISSGSVLRVVHQAAIQSHLKHDRPVHGRTLFPIWSMTKPITSLAVMMLYERGLIELDDSVAEQIPTLATLKVRGGGWGLLPLARPITTDISCSTLRAYTPMMVSFMTRTWKEVMELEDLESLMRLLARQPFSTSLASATPTV